ncbi:MAG: VWA domain-containing protein [Gammaproteobacteria bacterium]|nr:VWA domain-containing protein [Gammaproteobacteria bacterium]MDH3465944.1 VWA domain-containing protein [Gammaproteobacteria bacterium]
MTAVAFHFLRPWWWLALPLGWMLIMGLWRRQTGGDSWRTVCDSHLLPHLLVGPNGGVVRVPYVLLGIAWLLVVFALAGPSWRQDEQPVFRTLAARVIVLDVSRSMDAADVTPSRLARAKFKAADILSRAADRQTGLVVFAGAAFTVSPLTDDANTLLNLLRVLNTDVVPVQGGDTAAGLRRAEELLRSARATTGEAIVITDSVAPDMDAAAAAIAARGFRVSVLAAGTAAGAPIPLAGGGFLKDSQGAIVLPRTDFELLRQLAEAGGGKFVRMTADDSDIDALLQDPIVVPTTMSRDRRHTEVRYRDEGPWFVLLLLPLAALAFRRGWVLTIAVVIVVAPYGLPLSAHAFEWQDLWKRSDQQAADALARGDAATAAEVARDPAWRGGAYYRQQQFPAAADAFAAQDDAAAHYNRGNALAKGGRLQEALEEYQTALRQAPDLDDARHNHDLVERLLQQAERNESGRSGEPSTEPGANSEKAGDGTDSESDSRRSESGDQSADAEDSASRSEWNPDGRQTDMGEAMSTDDLSEKGDDGSRPDDAAQSARLDTSPNRSPDKSDESTRNESGANPTAADDEGTQSLDPEQQQALDQWLRRIPDDPGGLLRRKFAWQYQRRANPPPTATTQW